MTKGLNKADLILTMNKQYEAHVTGFPKIDMKFVRRDIYFEECLNGRVRTFMLLEAHIEPEK